MPKVLRRSVQSSSGSGPQRGEESGWGLALVGGLADEQSLAGGSSLVVVEGLLLVVLGKQKAVGGCSQGMWSLEQKKRLGQRASKFQLQMLSCSLGVGLEPDCSGF